MPDVAVGGWVLRAKVPDGTFTLAIEAEDRDAAAEHAVFADRCQSLLLRAVGGDAAEVGWLRDDLAGERDGRPALLLLGIAAKPLSYPDGIDPASLLAAMLKGQYPDAAVEEFATAQAAAVGVRRCDTLCLPPGGDGEQLTIDVGISQALVPFPDAGLLGQVTGCSFRPEDVDMATVFTATIAHHLAVARAAERSLLPGDGDGDGVAVAKVQQAAAGTRRLPDESAREPHADQVTFRERGRGGQAAAPRSLGVDLPAAEPEADALGVSGEDQGSPGIAAERDQPAELRARIAVAQEFRVVDEHHPALTERGLGMDELLCAQLRAVEHAMHPG
jgi:hypothetical protein